MSHHPTRTSFQARHEWVEKALAGVEAALREVGDSEDRVGLLLRVEDWARRRRNVESAWRDGYSAWDADLAARDAEDRRWYEAHWNPEAHWTEVHARVVGRYATAYSSDLGSDLSDQLVVMAGHFVRWDDERRLEVYRDVAGEFLAKPLPSVGSAGPDERVMLGRVRADGVLRVRAWWPLSDVLRMAPEDFGRVVHEASWPPPWPPFPRTPGSTRWSTAPACSFCGQSVARDLLVVTERSGPRGSPRRAVARSA